MNKIKIKKCPRCGENKDMTYPAISRKDNKTEICSQCGMEEAMQQFKRGAKVNEW